MVLGKVRVFHRITIGKMAHTAKRGLPEENNDGSLDDYEGNVENQETNSYINSLPPFLRQSHNDIRKKFEDLEWMQRARMAEGVLAQDPSHRWALEADPEIKARNRYMNVQAWANYRIRLRVPEGECDFINASPIVLEDSITREKRPYIATQGPKLEHLTQFWQMVLHESGDVAVIVMLTQTFESGREKCAQYFPLDAEHSPMILLDGCDRSLTNGGRVGVNETKLGHVSLLEYSWDDKSRSELRKLELTLGSVSKIVWHFLFAGWADYSTPEGEDRNALLKLIALSETKAPRDNPRVIHCSAGVGRTGTFIALDHLLKELESGALLQVSDSETDPVFETVNRMREQRMMMVYNEMQLQFLYEVLRERAELKLGRPGSGVRSPWARSAKLLKLSEVSDYLPAPKGELDSVSDHNFTPTAGPSDISGASHNG